MMRTDSAAPAGAAEHRHLLADSVADFAARGTDIARVRRLRGTSAEYDRAVWKKMAELGWLGILVPERYGGLGLGLAEMAIVAQRTRARAGSGAAHGDGGAGGDCAGCGGERCAEAGSVAAARCGRVAARAGVAGAGGRARLDGDRNAGHAVRRRLQAQRREALHRRRGPGRRLPRFRAAREVASAAVAAARDRGRAARSSSRSPTDVHSARSG